MTRTQASPPVTVWTPPNLSPSPPGAGVERGCRHAAAARHGLLVAIEATDAQEVVTAAYRPDRDDTGIRKRTVSRNEGVSHESGRDP